MNKTLKVGLVLFGTGVLLNILVRLVGPSIVYSRLDSANFVELVALGIGMILSVVLILAGAVTCLVGALKTNH